MLTFVSAYSIVLLAVVAYVARMDVRQRELLKTVESWQIRTDLTTQDAAGADDAGNESQAA